MNKLKFRETLLGFQFLIVAFGATVLMPLITGLPVSVALFTSGLGTIIFYLITKGKVPVYLGSSFAFISPVIIGINTWGISDVLSGLIAAGAIYFILSILIKTRGADLVKRIFPPIVTGPIIMSISILLIPVAFNLAKGLGSDGTQLVAPNTALILALVSALITITVALKAKGIFKLVSILFGVAGGYIAALFFGIIDFSPIVTSPWIALPAFVLPTFNINAILLIAPFACASAVEHFGDISAISEATENDFAADPGLHRTLFADGLATSLAGFVGGPPNTTYSEVTGAVIITKVKNPVVMLNAGIIAVLFSFIGKLSGFLQTIPVPVMGGVMVILFGSIMIIGVHSLTKVENLTSINNIVIASVILSITISNFAITIGTFSFSGIGLAAIVGIILNLLLGARQKAVA